MRAKLAIASITLLTLATAASAQTWENGYDGMQQHYSGWYHGYGRPHRANGRHSDCGNGDCRGANSPGILGGAPGDF